MLTAVRVWILLSSLLVGAGWGLSAIRALNRVGYAAVFFGAGLLLIFWLRKNSWFLQLTPSRLWSKFKKRFAHPAPFIFSLMVLLNLFGGFLERPDNGDTNSYRIPRVLHWLWQEHWHWIHTADSRMNIAGCGFEWLFTPLILFTGTDRWLFLINALPHILLPGLIFDVLRRMRIAPRVAWWWMWILASGWCFVLQACSTLNDSLGAIYALAAVAFALRARESGKPGDLWLSLLAAGLLTGLKQTNLPLLLPWFMAAWPARRCWRTKPVSSCTVIALTLLISAATLACLNWKYAGTWTGFPTGTGSQVLNWGQMQELKSPFWGILGNSFCLPAQNLMPPFFPWSDAWNAAMGNFVHTRFGSHFSEFEVFGRLDHSITTTNAGIGLAIIFLTAVSIWGASRFRLAAKQSDWNFRALQIAPWLALLVFMAKVGTYENARHAAPYYLLLFPLILAGAGHAQLVRRSWWQWLAVGVLCFTLACVGFLRGRSVLPARVVAQLESKFPREKTILVSVFGNYNAARASVEAERNLPQTSGIADERIIGYATTYSGAEPGWWLPFGQRQVERVLPDETPLELQQKKIHYVVVETVAFIAAGETIGQWAEFHRGDVARELILTNEINAPPRHVYVVRLRE